MNLILSKLEDSCFEEFRFYNIIYLFFYIIIIYKYGKVSNMIEKLYFVVFNFFWSVDLCKLEVNIILYSC